MMIEVKIFSVAGIGKINEDYALHVEIAPGVSLIIVCDGMCGLSYGNEASKLVAHTISEYIESNYSTQSPEQTIVNAIKYANNRIANECIRLHARMGVAVALMLLAGYRCYYTWLGDVRIYHNQEGMLELLTKDHLALESNHSFLTRSITGREFHYSLDVSVMTLCPGEEMFIATDGFYLFNEIGTPITRSIEVADDSTIVRIRLV